jgi:hypothetical protein
MSAKRSSVAFVPAQGRAYAVDEEYGRLVIHDARFGRRIIGGGRDGAGRFERLRGVAVLAAPTAAASRIFICDLDEQRVRVLDGDGRLLALFGRSGSSDGRFADLADVTVAFPRFRREDIEEGDARAAYVVVADAGDNRIHIFTPDGLPVRALGATPWATPDRVRAVLPFCRQAARPRLEAPARLVWRAPWLDVTCRGGRVVRIDLADALLPGFEAWRRRATPLELRAARTLLHMQAREGEPAAAAALAHVRAAERARAARSPREGGLVVDFRPAPDRSRTSAARRVRRSGVVLAMQIGPAPAAGRAADSWPSAR